VHIKDKVTIEEEEVYLFNTQHTVYRHAHDMCNIRIAIKC